MSYNKIAEQTAKLHMSGNPTNRPSDRRRVAFSANFRIELMHLRPTTKLENGLRPRSYSKIFVFNTATPIFIAAPDRSGVGCRTTSGE